MDVIRKWQRSPGPGPAFLGNLAARPLGGNPELFRVSWVKNLIVETRDSSQPIAAMRLDHVRMTDRTGALFYEIGEIEFADKPHAEEALRLVLELLFGEQNLRRVYTYLMDHEKNMVALFEKTGFKKEAVLPERLFYGGKYHPVSIYGLLGEELH